MIPLRDQEVLRQRFATELTGRVRLDYFTQRPSRLVIPGREECALCQEAKSLLEELASLSPKIALTVHDIEDEIDAAAGLAVDKVPGIVIRGVTNRQLRFFGIPSGNEFPGFVETLINASTGKADLRPATVQKLRRVRSDVSVQVFVTPTSPYAPALARTAFRVGLMAPRVKVSLVEASEFPSLVQRYGIRGVPTVVFDERVVLPGAMDEAGFVEALLKVVEKKPLTSADAQRGGLTLLPDPNAKNVPQRTASGIVLPR